MAVMTMNEPDFTFGIEEEYLLVDSATRDLVCEMPPAILEECTARLGKQVSAEFFRSQIEIGTAICRTPAESLAELQRLQRSAPLGVPVPVGHNFEHRPQLRERPGHPLAWGVRRQ